MRYGAVIVLATFFLMPVLAQVPGFAPDSVAIGQAPESVDVSVEHPSEVTVEVRHEGGAPAPLGQPRRFFVSADAPEGWTVTVTPSDFMLDPGASRNVTVRIATSADASDDADVRVTAVLVPLGANVVPGVGPTVDPESEDSVTIQAHRADSVTRDVLEALDPWIWFVFLALLAAIIVAIKFGVDTRQTGVRLVSGQTGVDAVRGKNVSLQVTVENIGKEVDSIVLQARTLPEGWHASVHPASVELEPGERHDVEVQVRVPKDATKGVVQSVLVTAQSSQTPRRPGHMSFDVRVSD